MKLKRAWPAICIWVVFVLFDIVMVASSSFFSGLFPSENLLVYVGVFTVLSILGMSILTYVMGKVSDSLMAHNFKENVAFKIVYGVLATLIIVGGIWYRLEIISSCSGDITGKYSLYENAMVGSQNITPEYDLLSIVYSAILKFIMFFTGNIIAVPFFFQIACFTIFMICCFFTVKRLLGMSAAIVFTAYVAFMPVFTNAFTGLELSTDSLFMAMFGIELLLVGQYLKGAYKGLYKYKAWVIGYFIVGIAVGFMAYLDAGTIIMIAPFFLASLYLYGRKPGQEAIRLLFVLLAAAITFFGMIAQEAGFAAIPEHLSKWANYYFHNMNTFSMFWAYTDHKLIYLITVIVMSGVLIGFWKNRKVEKISPWLLSMLFIFATVPFMGPTRMNTQVFVTVYYAFILGCVASLITLPAEEGGDYDDEVNRLPINSEAEATAIAAATGVSSVVQPDYEFEDEPEEAEKPAAEEPVTEESAVEEPVTEESAAEEPVTEEPVAEESVAEEPESEEPVAEESVSEQTKPRYVPEGMVLPEDDEDVDLTPRMKMPVLIMPIGVDGKAEKLRINRDEPETPDETEPEISADTGAEETLNSPETVFIKDDFDLELKPGDDFDI